MMQLAVYGKGGIGKSTVSANISVALAMRGYRVMQIGCDPKHDSTRLLLGGKAQGTVLDYVRDVPAEKRKLDDVIVAGSFGVLCAEAGGPEPGIGCAGRGILTTFDTLKRLGADSVDHDFRVYDVLGDVVCGGFAVPLRSEYADAIVLVTSGEFMSMYAANNIMKGMANFDPGRPRLLGVILNCRGVEGEEASVRAFAEATGTEVIAVLPRDGVFAEAESSGHTVREIFPDSPVSAEVDAIADRLVAVSEGRAVMYSPIPLDDDQLSDLAAGRAIRPHPDGTVHRTDRVDACAGCLRRSIKGTRVMSSCAAYGALSAFSRIVDIAVVLHGPHSCMYLMDTTRAKVVLEQYRRGSYPILPSHSIWCTDMDDSASIFGAADDLEGLLMKVASDGHDHIAVVTTCMSGIIGDDCVGVVERVLSRIPGLKIDLIQADGDITGDYNDGFDMAIDRILDMVDMSVEPDPGYVNIIGASFMELSDRRYAGQLRNALARFGLRINSRFLDECDSDSVRLLRRGFTDIILSDSNSNRILSRKVSARLGREPFPCTIPLGLRSLRVWADAMGGMTGRMDAAAGLVDEAESDYAAFMVPRRGRFTGTKVMVVCGMTYNIGWILDVLQDLGADIVRVAFLANPRRKGPGPRLEDYKGEVIMDYTIEDMESDMSVLEPDLVVGDIPRPPSAACRFARIVRSGFGVQASMNYATYLENSLRLPDDEGWKGGRMV